VVLSQFVKSRLSSPAPYLAHERDRICRAVKMWPQRSMPHKRQKKAAIVAAATAATAMSSVTAFTAVANRAAVRPTPSTSQPRSSPSFAVASTPCVSSMSSHLTAVGISAAFFSAVAAAEAGRGLKMRRRATDGDVLAEAKAAAEAAKLELEAAKLRAQVVEMEQASKVEKRNSRAGRILSGSLSGADGEYAVSAEELVGRLKEMENMEVTDSEAKLLAYSAGVAEGGRLKYEQLSSEAFDVALSKVMREKQESKRSVERELAEEATRLQAEQRAQQTQPGQQQTSQQQPYPTDYAEQFEVNNDLSQGTRILACLAYILPIVDCYQFGLYLVQLFPFLTPVFALLAVPNAILNLIPFGLGTLIFFAAWLLAASNRELPRLLRFNLQQALLLDIAAFTVNIIGSVFSGGMTMDPTTGLVCFVTLIAAIVYACSRNVNGEYPDGIPVISGTTQGLIDGPGNFGGEQNR